MKIIRLMHRWITAGAFISCFCLGTVDDIRAGGYMAVDKTGQPYKWPGAVELRFDKGPLGRLSKAEADALTQAALNAWMAPAIPGSNVQFVRGPDLDEDHGDGVSTNPAFELEPPFDGITPVIYDQAGLIIEQLGSGLSDSVVGLTGLVLPDDLSPAPLSEGFLVMNGKMISQPEGNPGVLPISQYFGAIIHELGHMLNLGHAQAGMAFTETGYDTGSLGGPYVPRFPPDYSGIPTMFPAVMPEIDSLEIDDISWMKSLYGDSSGTQAGSISGVIENPNGNPFSGANVVAYSVDNPTSVVTCVSGFSDADPVSTPTGRFLIPGLPPGSKWIVDVEPVVGLFVGGSKVGPISPPLPLPSMPEYVNEPGIESDSDNPSLSTTFAIPSAGGTLHHVANLRFNDPNLIDVIQEIDTGTDEHTGQMLSITPGRMTMVEGVIDPAEPNPQIYGLGSEPLQIILGQYHDFYRVKHPAGVELNLLAVVSDGSVLDTAIFDLSSTADSEMINGTASGMGFPSLSFYLDSSRIGADETFRGTYSFGVAFTGPFAGGTMPFQLSNYMLIMAFSPSDRDNVALAGTDSGQIDPTAGLVRLRGRGFKNMGGAPEVTFEAPGIAVTHVTFVDENNLDVEIVRMPGYAPGLTTVQVMNRLESGGYGGRIEQMMTGEPSAVIGWELY